MASLYISSRLTIGWIYQPSHKIGLTHSTGNSNLPPWIHIIQNVHHEENGKWMHYCSHRSNENLSNSSYASQNVARLKRPRSFSSGIQIPPSLSRHIPSFGVPESAVIVLHVGSQRHNENSTGSVIKLRCQSAWRQLLAFLRLNTQL